MKKLLSEQLCVDEEIFIYTLVIFFLFMPIVGQNIRTRLHEEVIIHEDINSSDQSCHTILDERNTCTRRRLINSGIRQKGISKYAETRIYRFLVTFSYQMFSLGTSNNIFLEGKCPNI